jgi:16S rRNA (guanine966-N2)-methyltransferase
MRIISGNFKGKKILQPKDEFTRPLKDLTKESIFNIIKHSNLFDICIEESSVLDLFSGVGSFGLECISRGASSVTFLENYPAVLSILKKNIINLKCQKETKIIQKNIFEINKFNFLKDKFDIIFLDPPYKKQNLSFILESLFTSNVLKNKSIFIIHRHKNEKDILPGNFKILKESAYGISKIIFGKKN